MLAGRERLEHQGFRDAVAADQLDDDVDLGVVEDIAGVVRHHRPALDDTPGAFGIEIGHHRDHDVAPGAAHDFLAVAREHAEGAAAYRADAEQAYLNRFHIFQTKQLIEPAAPLRLHTVRSLPDG